jgi:hypothetical protein
VLWVGAVAAAPVSGTLSPARAGFGFLGFVIPGLTPGATEMPRLRRCLRRDLECAGIAKRRRRFGWRTKRARHVFNSRQLTANQETSAVTPVSKVAKPLSGE